MTISGHDVDQKLRLTAAVVGAGTCKELAAAFRRINPATPFDLERAYKWLQGRARPREMQVYEDWAKLLDLGRTGRWIADCDIDSFIDALSARYPQDRETLRNLAGPADAAMHERGESLAGTYVCYSQAWSPYFQGRLIRGELSLAPAATTQRLNASYTEVLPTGRLILEGPVRLGSRAVTIDVHEKGGEAHFLFSLFPPTPPASLLTGLMCGATLIGPDAQPSVTRVVIVRLPAPSLRLRQADAYLPADPSIAADLATFGLHLAEPAAVDRQLLAFLTRNGHGGLDQPSAADHRALVDVFDRNWFAPAREAIG